MTPQEKRILLEKLEDITRRVIVMEGKEKKSKELTTKRRTVMKWLNSAQELHSVLAYKLWPKRDKDAARSLFSKKYRGKDADGKVYGFSDEEITTLFNMKDRYIDKIS